MRRFNGKRHLFLLTLLLISGVAVTGLLAQDPDRSAIVTGDFNNDGILDFAITNLNRNSVSVFLSTEEGFELAGDFEVAEGPMAIAAGDFNEDGNLDLATANSNANTVSVLLGNGDGTFQTVINYPVPRRPRSISTGDFNRHGHLDLVALTSDGLCFLLGHGNGTFDSPRCLTLESPPDK